VGGGGGRREEGLAVGSSSPHRWCSRVRVGENVVWLRLMLHGESIFAKINTVRQKIQNVSIYIYINVKEEMYKFKLKCLENCGSGRKINSSALYERNRSAEKNVASKRQEI